MKRKLAFALVSAATLAVVPAFAEGEATTTTTTATATAAAPAAAGGEKEFGNPGVINFGAATNLTFAAQSDKDKDGNDAGKSTTFGLEVNGAYFVAEGISVGADLGFASVSSKDAKGNDAGGSTTIKIGPQVGYNIWLSPPMLSLWPQARFLYATTSTKSGGNDGPTFTKMSVGVWVPLLIHPVKHFHFGVGPFVDLDISSKAKAPGGGDSVDGNKSTTFGLLGEIAGWL